VTRIAGPVLDFPGLDAPHADMLQRAAELASAAVARQDRKVASILDGLLEATALHFAFEEELMERTVYPERGAHRSAHELFLQDLHLSAQEIARAGVSPRILEWATVRLQQWLRFHMEANDRPLALHLQRVAHAPLARPSQRPTKS
jgi:hemerythrin-like metal-binding protein